MTTFAFALLFAASVFGYAWNRQAASSLRNDGQRLHSLSGFHGLYSFLCVSIPVFVLILVWLVFQGSVIDWLVTAPIAPENYATLETGPKQLVLAEIKSIAGGRIFGTPEDWKLAAAERLIQLRTMSAWLLLAAVFALAVTQVLRARRRVDADFRARQGAERMILGLIQFCAIFAVFVTVGIVFSLTFETIKFFRMVPPLEFLFGLNWEPQIPIRADQIAGAGAFGWLPVIVGTMVITVIAILVAVPTGLLTAIYLNEFASSRARAIIKPILEILSGIPTIVYGFFAVLVVAPAMRQFGADLGIAISPNTALAAGSVMGVMLIPFISSFADDALSAVPQSLRDGALALGATRGETMLSVLFPAAIPGIVGGVLLAVSRAIGETMIVVMAAGLIANMTLNPLDSVTTVTVQIVTLLIGDTSFDNPKTLAAFALGMMLFLVTLVINIFALRIVRKYREIYD
ncbi:phosphate ABC transporter permease subunit PstC [Loktanella sp. SALINAS62]|uniref:phosphate ABC transporter permease subunit PstC n=1 Tax=Loktanella sp. SALINAS62 TaxID=2706124 RepID=UPI001B8B1503|nr:phosphate ABC transporter permease subunit PstC [Loktanella sp. SALINAS62]MBS1303251.1 phosphate ABC transporter permease subunit PstC [Loktanella sp. SALINAS62]